MADILCLGELLIDMVSTHLEAGLADAPGFIRAAGGAPANVAVGISRLGISSGFIGCVGEDHFGIYLQRCLDEEGVDIRNLKRTREARTTLAFIAVRKDQKKEIIFYRNPGADMMLKPEDIDIDFLRRARIFHFGSISLIDEPSRSATFAALEHARDAGLIVSYDPNYRPDLWSSPGVASERMRSVFNKVDIVKISEEEWAIIVGDTGLEDGGKYLFELGVKAVIVSRGEKGACLMVPGFIEYVPAFTVEVVETTGAGDAFVAAVLTQIIRRCASPAEITGLTDKSWIEIIRRANAAGALACTKPGAIPALPRLNELEQFVQQYL